MALLGSIFVGAGAGGLAALVRRSADVHATSSVAVGILGALLGAAANFWIGTGTGQGLSLWGLVASAAGALVTLLLWIIAQRLFFSNPGEQPIGD